MLEVGLFFFLVTGNCDGQGFTRRGDLWVLRRAWRLQPTL